jgi:heterodisulfide reductase subunit A
MVSLKQAILAREKLGENADIYLFHIDMRSFGKGYEEFYRRARDLDINLVSGMPSEIHATQDGVVYFDVFDKATNRLLEVRADLVVLANGLVPTEDMTEVNRLFHASRSADGFLLEAHPKLRPLESSTAGIFLAGACQAPKDIPDTVAQASGAATKIIDLLSAGELELEPLKAEVDNDLCSGCRVCESVCPFFAVEMETEKGDKLEAQVVEAMCQGCGLCAASCPTGAIKMKHYTDAQVWAEVQTAFAAEATRTKGGS